MAWVRLAQRYIYTPSRDRRCAVVYEPGARSVPEECAAKVVAAGIGERIKTPPRGHAPEAS